MTEAKKKGGMAGKHHPKDENDQTALGWAHGMRRRSPPPDGCKIMVKFSEGPSGGTWGRTKGQFRAIDEGGVTIGTFGTWKAARSALMDGAGSKPANKSDDRRVTGGTSGAIGGVRRSVSSELVEMMAGPEGKSIMLSVAFELDRKASEMVLRAESLRSAAESL